MLRPRLAPRERDRAIWSEPQHWVAAAGIGVSIVPRSSITAGMQVLPKGRSFPDPGPLDVGVIRGTGARADILEALERVIGETLRVQALTRRAA